MNAFNKIVSIGLITLAQGCFFHSNTKTISKRGSLEQTQQYAFELIALELIEDPDLTYFEVYTTEYRFVLNYNQRLQVLTLEDDFCSGIAAQFVKVTPFTIQQLAKQKVSFRQLWKILKRHPPESKPIEVPHLTC